MILFETLPFVGATNESWRSKSKSRAIRFPRGMHHASSDWANTMGCHFHRKCIANKASSIRYRNLNKYSRVQ